MTSQRWNICSLITELRIGGAQNVLYDIVTSLPQDRYRQLVVCLFGADETADRLRATGLEVVDLHMRSKLDIGVGWRLWRVLRDFGPHLLHSHMFHANLLARILGRLAGVPRIVCTEHTMGQEGSARRLLNRLTAPLADRITAVSEPVGAFARDAIGISPERVVVIPNGIDVQRCQSALTPEEARQRLGLAPKHFVVGTVGTLRQVKGTDMLLRAFAQLGQQLPQAQLLVVGDGPEWDALQALADELGIRDQTVFTGNRSDVADLLAAMGVFVLSSHWEGLPIAALEAMAAGLPVVATAVGGTPGVVLGGKTGLLVPASDPPALAQALQQLLSDPQRARAMGEAGRHRVEAHYTKQHMVEQMEALYQELLVG